MYIVEKTRCIIDLCEKSKRFEVAPESIYQSRRWRIWHTIITPFTCYHCASMNGRILPTDEPLPFEIPVHENCRCYITAADAIVAGAATADGSFGVDLYVLLHGQLPDKYLTQSAAKAQGWKKHLGNLAEVLPGRIIGGDIYRNRDHRLPEAAGRIWFEADLSYTSGFRDASRLLFSNDGLVFVTYESPIRPHCVRTNRDERVQTSDRLSCKIILRRTHTTAHGEVSRRLHPCLKQYMNQCRNRLFKHK